MLSAWHAAGFRSPIPSQPARQRAWPSNSKVMPLRGTNTATLSLSLAG
jgi:hypothetical protein